MAAAPPSAAGAEASGAGVAKASEVCTHPSREVEEEKKDDKVNKSGNKTESSRDVKRQVTS